jgi:serine/threonine-protein kinase RsbW
MMDGITHRYDDLDQALDTVRALLERWSAGHEAAVRPSPDAVRHAQLVLHEWIANLIQHADFTGRAPKLVLSLKATDTHLEGTVTDNSHGFDVERQLRRQNEAASSLPDRGMGLRIIDACTDSFAYRKTDEEHHTFTFCISADLTPWLSTLF